MVEDSTAGPAPDSATPASGLEQLVAAEERHLERLARAGRQAEAVIAQARADADELRARLQAELAAEEEALALELAAELEEEVKRLAAVGERVAAWYRNIDEETVQHLARAVVDELLDVDRGDGQ